MHFNQLFSSKKRLLKAVRYTAIGLITVVLFPAMALAAPPSPLNPASPATRSIANLHTIVLWIASLVFAIVCGLLLYSIVRFRRKSEDDPEPDQSFHGSALLETIWTIVPVGILLALLVLTFQTFQDTDPNRPTDMTIKVTGKQWLWEVEYPDQDIKLTNEMRIPVDTDIKIEIEADDVLHSFWVPQLGGKVDAVPGYLTYTWFRADRLGTFHGQCAEYCGLGHAVMPMEVTVLSPDNFEVWASNLAEQQANAGAQGQLLFQTNCSSCHMVAGEGGQIGPELTNVHAEKGEEYIRESILMPNAIIAPVCPTGACLSGVMPQNFAEVLSPDELDNIVTYLQEASGVE
jgi:cytochrome c oxidase subunit 2